MLETVQKAAHPLSQFPDGRQEPPTARLLRSLAAVLSSLSLKTRVVLLVVMILLAGIWSLALNVTLALERDLTRLISSTLSEEARSVAADLDRDVQLHIDALHRLAASLKPEILSNPANLALVEQLIARRSDLKLLTAIDAIDQDGGRSRAHAGRCYAFRLPHFNCLQMA